LFRGALQGAGFSATFSVHWKIFPVITHSVFRLFYSKILQLYGRGILFFLNAFFLNAQFFFGFGKFF
ncbi:MAG: hypothetical protein LBD91_07000, partial [Prevotellaceae bacterium]|nr:hypothetical protein [Prevotellaceae bacterium]